MLLTDAEFTIALQRFIDKFACAELDNANGEKWLIKVKISAYKAKLLYLYFYAVSTYIHSDLIDNYLTEKQVLEIFSKANTIC